MFGGGNHRFSWGNNSNNNWSQARPNENYYDEYVETIQRRNPPQYQQSNTALVSPSPYRSNSTYLSSRDQELFTAVGNGICEAARSAQDGRPITVTLNEDRNGFTLKRERQCDHCQVVIYSAIHYYCCKDKRHMCDVRRCQ